MPYSIEDWIEDCEAVADIGMMMKDSHAGILFSIAAPVIAVLAHLVMFYIGGPVPYPVIGAIAAGCGLAGIICCWGANRESEQKQVSVIFPIIATVGLLLGVFYASFFGPWIVFFPKI